MMQIQIIIRKSCSKDPLLQNMFCHFRICSFTIVYGFFCTVFRGGREREREREIGDGMQIAYL